jgi:peptidoglycan/LPS O-acetylase OafA/YrhL
MRLLPAFWLVLLFVILLLDLSLIDSVWEFVKPFLLVFFLVTTSPVDWLPGTEHTWTVPTEMAFYLAIPVIAWATNAWARRATDAKTRTRRLLWPLWALALVGAGWTAFAFLPSNMAYAFYYYFWPIGYIGFFAAGMALAVIAAHRDVTGEVPGLHRFVARHPLLPWLAGGVVLLLNMPKPFGERGMGDWGAFTQAMTEHVAFYVFALLLVVPLTVPDARSRFIDTVLTNRPLRSIGRLSYGVYLWHVPVMYLWFRHGNIFGNEPISVLVPREQLPAAELIGFAVWVVVGTAVFTLLSYYLVERPVVRMRTRFGAPKSSLDQAYEPTPGRP